MPITWFSSALAVSPLCAAYASRTQHDAKFGALVDTFIYQWIGSGLINPPKSCAEKAIRWALQCTTATDLVLHVALVAMSPTMTALLKRYQADGRMHVLFASKLRASQAGLRSAGSMRNRRSIRMVDS